MSFEIYTPINALMNYASNKKEENLHEKVKSDN